VNASSFEPRSSIISTSFCHLTQYCSEFFHPTMQLCRSWSRTPRCYLLNSDGNRDDVNRQYINWFGEMNYPVKDEPRLGVGLRFICNLIPTFCSKRNDPLRFLFRLQTSQWLIHCIPSLTRVILAMLPMLSHGGWSPVAADGVPLTLRGGRVVEQRVPVPIGSGGEWGSSWRAVTVLNVQLWWN